MFFLNKTGISYHLWSGKLYSNLQANQKTLWFLAWVRAVEKFTWLCRRRWALPVTDDIMIIKTGKELVLVHYFNLYMEPVTFHSTCFWADSDDGVFLQRFTW